MFESRTKRVDNQEPNFHMFVKAHLKHELEYFLCRKHLKQSIHILHNFDDSNHPQLEDKFSLVLGDILRILNSNLNEDLPQ